MNAHTKKVQGFIQYLIQNVKAGEGDVLNDPFFQPSSEELELDTLQEKANLTQDEKNFLENHIELKLRLLYTLLGSKVQGSVNNFSFLSLEDIIDRYKNYPNFYDIGLLPAGMGHVVCLSYWPNDSENPTKGGEYFFRSDGGSNGWEREGNYQYYSRSEFKTTCNTFSDLQEVINTVTKLDNVIDFWNSGKVQQMVDFTPKFN